VGGGGAPEGLVERMTFSTLNRGFRGGERTSPKVLKLSTHRRTEKIIKILQIEKRRGGKRMSRRIRADLTISKPE